MKRKKIFSVLVLLAMVMGITACAVGKDGASEAPNMQPESISTEKGDHERKETAFHNAQDRGTQGNEGQEAETQQPGTQETQQPETDKTQQSGTQETQQPETNKTQRPGAQNSQKPEMQETQQSETDKTQQPGIQETQQPGTQESQRQAQEGAEVDLEERLAQYRAEREGMTNVAMGNGVSGYGAPNAENFGFQANATDYTQNFDSGELNKAYETAKKYVTETLAISVETNAVVYPCVDPRITEIYEAEDKGVAEGYDSKNIFVCEYCDNGTWQYLIIVRDGKDSGWSVIHHGGSYKE